MAAKARNNKETLDESTYKEELVKKGLAPETAAAIAAKTKTAQRERKRPDVAPKTEEILGERNKKLEKAQKNAYLSARKIDPKGPFQLDILFPDLGYDNQRFIPNDCARSSLFTVRNKRMARRNFTQEPLFHTHSNVAIKYTGIELRAENDELVWLQLLHYGKSGPLGEPFEFQIKDLVHDVGWNKNGRYYDMARECISRLRATELLFQNEKAYGLSATISLIKDYVLVNDRNGKPTHYRMWIDPEIIVLFAGNTFTNHAWEQYKEYSPIARRLADYAESHRHPYPLPLEDFGNMCASLCSSPKKWADSVRSACENLEEAGAVDIAQVKNGKIFLVKK